MKKVLDVTKSLGYGKYRKDGDDMKNLETTNKKDNLAVINDMLSGFDRPLRISLSAAMLKIASFPWPAEEHSCWYIDSANKHVGGNAFWFALRDAAIFWLINETTDIDDAASMLRYED